MKQSCPNEDYFQIREPNNKTINDNIMSDCAKCLRNMKKRKIKNDLDGRRGSFDKVTRERLFELVTFNKRQAGYERTSKVLQAERRINAKAFR